MTYTCNIETPLGAMTAAATENRLTGLWFQGQKYYPCATGGWRYEPEHPVFSALRLRLASYFHGEADKGGAPAGLTLAPEGSTFQMEVWGALLRIPFGETTTYGAIAKEIAQRTGLCSMSAQAVGGAVGRNPISILIPCHRVVGSNGGLTGYAGGVHRKEALLRLEDAAIISNLPLP